MCSKIYVVPDTNVWFNKREQLFSILECYKGFITIALPHITIDEERPETYKRAIVYKLDEKISYELFKQKLKNSVQDTMARRFRVIQAPVPGIYGVSRYGFAYYASKNDYVVLNLAVCGYISKGRPDYSTLKNATKSLQNSGAVVANEFKKMALEIEKGACSYDHFKTVIEVASSSCGVCNERVNSYVRRLYSILADILIITSCIVLARRECKPVVCVSEDKTLVSVLGEVLAKLRISNVHGYGLKGLAQVISQLVQSFR